MSITAILVQKKPLKHESDRACDSVLWLWLAEEAWLIAVSSHRSRTETQSQSLSRLFHEKAAFQLPDPAGETIFPRNCTPDPP